MASREDPLRPGERRQYLIEGFGRADLVAPTFSAPATKRGCAYLFEFPFLIHAAAGPFEVQTSRVDNTEIRIYPPFKPTADQSVRRIDPSAIPFVAGTVPPDYNKVGVRSTAVDQGLGDTVSAIRIDVVPDRKPEFAMRIAEQYVGLCRWWTGQWWIGQDDRHIRDYLCNWFDVNDAGERLSGINAATTLYGLYGIERPLSPEHTQNIRGNISNGRHIPLEWDSILDAIYFQAGLRARRAALEAAMACEAGVASTVRRLGRAHGTSQSLIDKALSSNDFTVKLDKGVARLTGRRFSAENPSAFRDLQDLRDVRGQIAHGEPATFRDSSREHVPLEASHLTAPIRAALDSLQWLSQLS